MPCVELARDLGDLLQCSDHLVLLVPGTADTRHQIDAAALAQARPGLHPVNMARGSLVVQDALRAALDSSLVGWASLDVTDPEPLPAGHWLYEHPRVWLTTHTCAISPQVQRALVDKLLRSLDHLRHGRPLRFLISSGDLLRSLIEPGFEEWASTDPTPSGHTPARRRRTVLQVPPKGSPPCHPPPRSKPSMQARC